MKIALIGGTGFIGYNFVQLILKDKSITPIVYTTAPKSLVNIARHKIDIRYVPYLSMNSFKLDGDIEYVINFSHPFGERDGLTIDEQINVIVKFLVKFLKLNSRTKLIHISSMSVYEPFANQTEFNEDSSLKPPKHDSYAYSKLTFEKELLKFIEPSRILILRPTIVYGPYCRPWTDNIMASFKSGDVGYNSMDGLIQPLYVTDLSRFLVKQLNDFSSGIFNIAGNEKIKWLDFFEHFEDIVQHGKLIKIVRQDSEIKDYKLVDDIKSVGAILMKEPSFNRLAKPVTRFLPKWTKSYLTTCLRNVERKDDKKSAILNNSYNKPFFKQDRLVSRQQFNSKYNNFNFTDMSATREVLVDYFLYRFTDKIFGLNESDGKT